MATIAELKIIVDSSQVEKAKKDLASLGESATKVGASTKGFSDGMKNATNSSEEFSGAAQRLIARAKEMEATVGASKGGLLNYKASILGVADVVKPLATSLDTLTIAQKNQDAVTKEVARNQAVADTAKYKMIEALKEEIALYGKSKNEIALYRAEQLGIIDSVRPLVEELNRLKDARESADKAGKSGTDERISKKQQELEVLKLEGAELQKNSALIGEKANAEARIAEQQKAIEANRVKYESKQQEIAELKGVAEGERLLAEEKKKVVQSTEAERAAFLKLRGEIDPVKKQMETYYQQLEKIQELRSKRVSGKGGADLGELDELEKAVNSNISRMETLGATSGKTAKEIAFSMRGLPAQFTDIAVSLQGGQKPLTVMLQQGGQLKDMFGGIIPAFKAMGSYVIGLINPLNIMIAAVAGLGLAAYQGSQDVGVLNRSLILSGKMGVVSSKELMGYSKQIAEVSGTMGGAVSAISEVISVTGIHKDSLVDVTTAAIAWEKATGTAVKEVAADFAKLAGDPLSAVVELDKQYNFLTPTLYRNIQALKEAGKYMEATSAATEAMAQTIRDRSLVSIDNLGALARAYRAVKSAASGLFDTTREVGRGELVELEVTYQNQLNKATEEFSRVQKRAEAGDIVAINSYRKKQEEVGKLKELLESTKRLIEVDTNAPYVASIAAVNEQYKKTGNAVAIAKKETLDYMAATELARKDGKLSAEEELKYEENLARFKRKEFDAERLQRGDFLINEAKVRLELTKEEVGAVVKMGTAQKDLVRFKQEIADIEKQILDTGELSLSQDERSKINRKDELLAIYTERAELEKNHTIQKKSTSEAKKSSVTKNSAAEKLLMSMKAQHEVLKEQANTDIRLGVEAKNLIKLKEELALIEKKSAVEKLTLDEQSKLAARDSLIAQQTKNAELEEQNRLNKKDLELSKFQLGLDQQLVASKQRIVDLQKGAGFGDIELARMRERNALVIEEAKAIQDLQANTPKSEFDDKREAMEEYYTSLREQSEAYYEAEDEMQSQWFSGMESGFQNFLDQNLDLYSTLKSATLDVFTTLQSGIRDSLVQSIMYGENLRESMANLGNTIIEKVLGALIDVGLRYAVNAGLSALATKSETVAKLTGIATTTGAASIAVGSATAEAVIAGAAITAAYTPAAIAASIATMGSAAEAATTSISTQTPIMAASISASSLAGFKDGGYTGDRGVSEIAGVVHGKEFVFDAESTARIGVNNLEKIRSGGSGNGGGDTIISTQISVNAEQGMSEADARSQGEAAAAGFEAKVLTIIAEQRRAGGMLSTA